MTNLDSIFKSRDITLPTKVHLVKSMVFPVVMYGCESWTAYSVSREVPRSVLKCETVLAPLMRPQKFLDTPVCITKQTHYFANNGPSSQSYGFSHSHIWM